MKQKDYVSYHVAKLLKEKRYNEISRSYYYDGKFFGGVFELTNDDRKGNGYCSAPSLAQAAKWIRTEHHIFITVTPEYSKSYEMIEYRVRITTYWDAVEGKKGHLLPLWFEKYEDALDTGIEEALKKL